MDETGKTFLWVLLIVLLPMGMLGGLWSHPLSAGEDDVLYYYPLRTQVGQALASGDWPISDSRTAGGMAVLADPQSAVFFPTTWLFAVVSGKLAYSLSIFIAFATAGLGMWLYLRRLGLVRPAAGFGAIAFMLGGFLVAHRVHLSMLQTAAFLPWGLWCFELLRRQNESTHKLADSLEGATTSHSALRTSHFFKAFAAIVPVFSLAVLAGHWPTVIQMSLVWFAYFLFRVRPLGRGLFVTALAGVLVVCMTAPQWTATLELMRQATRAKLGYAAVGENSYFPLSAVLWLFPFLCGTRWGNLYTQPWWGAWHFCETFGYVGLVTLVLAIVTAWKFFRRKHTKSTHKLADSLEGATNKDSLEDATKPCEGATTPISALRTSHSALVRTWVWLLLGAVIFMLGYYLSTYRLIYWLPVLGWVRCPARMLLAVDAGLVTLAAVGVHLLITGQGPAVELRTGLFRVCRRWLPITMIATLIVLGVLALVTGRVWPDAYPWPMCGSWRDAFGAVLPTNPAVWIPLALVVLTSVGVWYWLRRPGRNWPVLIALLLVDLATVAPFVDMPARGRGAGPSDPEISPAAAWLHENAPKDEPYRVWGLGDPYGRRQAELLLPRTNVVQGISSISTYGPFQNPAHAHLLGFRIFGTNANWRWLLWRNDLLRAYGVLYLIVEKGSEYEREIEKASNMLVHPSRGENLLTEAWECNNAERQAGVLTLRTPFMWRPAGAKQIVKLYGGPYRVSLYVRAEGDGAANYLEVQVTPLSPKDTDGWSGDTTMCIYPEQIGSGDWRHFEWTFTTPKPMKGDTVFRISSMSERPIEVRNVRLTLCNAITVLMKPPRYMWVTSLRAVHPGDPEIRIYQNMCFGKTAKSVTMSPKDIEALKGTPPGRFATVPEIGFARRSRRGPAWWLWRVTLPAGCIYLLGLIHFGFMHIRWNRSKTLR